MGWINPSRAPRLKKKCIKRSQPEVLNKEDYKQFPKIQTNIPA